jgi:hypothetical protein
VLRRLVFVVFLAFALVALVEGPRVLQAIEQTPASVHASEGRFYDGLLAHDSGDATLALIRSVRVAVRDGQYSDSEARSELRQMADLADGPCLPCAGVLRQAADDS